MNKNPADDHKKEETVVLKKEEFDKLQTEAQKAQEHWDRLLRQQADFENLRKRLERDKQEFVKFANEDLIAELLGILDDLERSVEAAEKKQENFEAFLKGIEMILVHLYELLKKRGVAPIDAEGKKFDPHEHEALMQTETPDQEDGIVLEAMQKGYKINGRVLRTAKVRVAKKINDKSPGEGK
ncbi:MAG: nucleotide exchange factor GrpE [Candidatus Omnitrophota bacterium]